jgi:predicted aspartyl protease
MKNRMLFTIWFFIFVFSISLTAFQDKKEEDYVKLSYDQESRGYIFIPVTMDGQEGMFFLDTGTGRTRVFPSFAKKLGLQGKEGKVKVKIGEMTWDDIAVLQNSDLGMRTPKGQKVVGILGGTFLQNTVLYLDAAKREVRFYRKVDDKDVKDWESVEIDSFKGAPFLQVKINDTEAQWFTIDTGADRCTILPKFYSAMKLDPDSPEAKPYEIVTAGGTFPAKLIPAKSVQIGNVKVENVITQVVIGNRSPWGNEGKKAGNIGQNLLKNLKVFIDYPKKKLYLKKSDREKTPAEREEEKKLEGQKKKEQAEKEEKKSPPLPPPESERPEE